MEARTISINGVIQRNTLLRIPYFQRRYVWGEEDWKRFAIDMESTLDSDRCYFLGAIILKEESVTMADRRNGIAKRQLVIDGQQRLTTLNIFMKVLHMMTGKNDDFANQYLQADDVKSPIIIHSCEDMSQFCKIMHLDAPNELQGDSNIVKAYNYFRTYLEGRRHAGINLNDLLNTVYACVTFVSISLTRDDDEQQIFDTINSLGVPLTTGELMKNFLYEADDEDAYRNNWRPMFDTDEARKFWESDASSSRQSKSKDNTTIERFFHAFVRIKMWDFKDLLTEVQRKNFVKTENIFITCKAFVEEFGMSKQDLAKEILEYAQLFKTYLNEEILDTRIPQHAGIKRIACLINATGNYAVIPYILYILHDVESEAERNQIFEFLETYLVRRILVKSSNNNYSDLFSENLIGQDINTCEGLKSYIDKKGSEKSLAMPTDNAVELKLKFSRMDETAARIVLYLYETKLTKTSDGVFNGGFNTYYAEQFIPRPCAAANDNWAAAADPDDEKYRQQAINTLGNYFLLHICNEKGLKKYHNEGFDKKLGLFKKFCRDIRSGQILDSLYSWDESAISNRNRVLAIGFCDRIWPLD